MTFNTIRAVHIRPGDKVPGPLSWGGWDKSRAVKVVSRSRTIGGGYEFALETGETFFVLPMNLVPFIPR